MAFHEIKATLDEKIQQTDKKLSDLKMRLERLEQERDQFLSDRELSSEELASYVADEANFHPELWMQWQEEKKALDEKLQSELRQVRDEGKAAKAYTERGGIAPHWLFVR